MDSDKKKFLLARWEMCLLHRLRALIKKTNRGIIVISWQGRKIALHQVDEGELLFPEE